MKYVLDNVVSFCVDLLYISEVLIMVIRKIKPIEPEGQQFVQQFCICLFKVVIILKALIYLNLPGILNRD